MSISDQFEKQGAFPFLHRVGRGFNWFGDHEVDWQAVLCVLCVICVLRVLCVLCYVCYVCYVSCGGLITAASCVLYNSNWFGYHEVDWICVLRVLCV